MIPIYEQGKGIGIGHSLDTFLLRFDAICLERLKAKGGGAFAFIFYDFKDMDLRRILKENEVFIRLDRLASGNLGVFFLHSGSRKAVQKFNSEFMSKLGVIEYAQLPCVVFFKIEDAEIRRVEVAQLDQTNLVNGFHNLYRAIEGYINGVSQGEYESLTWLKTAGRFVGAEVFRTALKAGLDKFL